MPPTTQTADAQPAVECVRATITGGRPLELIIDVDIDRAIAERLLAAGDATALTKQVPHSIVLTADYQAQAGTVHAAGEALQVDGQITSGEACALLRARYAVPQPDSSRGAFTPDTALELAAALTDGPW